jgi:predicted dehydrogenase/threonine dehydrogenase-like Zn-dependent dehydrogenase
MKQLLIKKGEVVVEDVPPPLVDDGSVLVEVKYSLISAGTEMTGVTASGESLLRKVLKQPEKVKQVLDMAKAQGISKTIEQVKGKLDSESSGTPTGYSCSGIVIDVGESIDDIQIGDNVACAGAGYANHAEIVCVPRNLVVKVPDNLGLKEAASATLGSIAMQGVRRANPTFGETIAVIGLGLVGQITAQILKVAGCRVIGIDLARSKVELAKTLGMDYGFIAGESDFTDSVMKCTSGYGADATIITAATESDLPVQQAMEMTRKKGKVVVVGAVGLHLKRSPFYEKEIDFLISCSYGPGRYDSSYEEQGIDYPYAYVRWTENRNMQEYLRMLAEGKINFNALISKEYHVTDASEAYRELKESENRPLGVLLRYGSEGTLDETKLGLERKIAVNPKPIKKEGVINVAVIGAGGFAQGVHLPNLQKLSDQYSIYAIVTRTGNNAKQLAKRFGADYCSTDYQEVLKDDNIDMVLIATRHNLHAKMAMESAKAGKAIFLEKPMAVNQQELDELVKVLEETQVPFMVGFNRRFSPLSVKAKEIISKRQNPMIITYRVNAGYIPLDHWVHTQEGGGRIIGEACHMLDLFNYFTDSEVKDIQVGTITPQTTDISPRDNLTVTLKYNDGSICTLTYTALGSNKLGKEYIEIYSDGKSLVIDDFKSLRVYTSKSKLFRTRTIEKGHLEEIKAFSQNIKSSSQPAIPIGQLVSATEISFTIDCKIRG